MCEPLTRKCAVADRLERPVRGRTVTPADPHRRVVGRGGRRVGVGERGDLAAEGRRLVGRDAGHGDAQRGVGDQDVHGRRGGDAGGVRVGDGDLDREGSLLAVRVRARTVKVPLPSVVIVALGVVWPSPQSMVAE